MIRNIQRKMRKARGFTLVELMIVVAIIGILAALAIYGVRKYMTNAKTGEVKTVVGRIAKDASGAFNREKIVLTTATLADGGVAGVSNTICGAAADEVPGTSSKIKGQKYQSAASEWDATSATVGWQCLKFSLSEPQYFQYNYTATATSGADGTKFEAIGRGDLDADSTLSTFKIPGEIRKGQIVLAPTVAETSPDE